MAEVGSGLAVEDHDAAILIAVGDEDLVVLGIHPDAGGAAEKLGVAAAGVFVVAADRHHEVAGARELHHAVVPVGAHPHVVVVVDEDAVRVAREFGHVLRRGVAPPLDEIPLGIELGHDRGRDAAGAERRVLHGGRLLRRERFRDVRDPDVIARVDEHARDGSHDPQVRHLARPARIHRERRHATLPGATLGGGARPRVRTRRKNDRKEEDHAPDAVSHGRPLRSVRDRCLPEREDPL